MALTAAAAATTILANATKALNAARERAQVSKDAKLKEIINTLYDEMLALREAVLRVTEENENLRSAKRAIEPELRRAGAVSHYYQGDEGPFCQPCFLRIGKLVMLNEREDWNDGIRRFCPVCREYFYEKPMDFGSVSYE
jgi:hypothetical protein